MTKEIAAAVAGLVSTAAMAVGTNLLKNPSFEEEKMPFRLSRYEVGWDQLKQFEDSRYRARPDAAHFREGARAYYLGCDNPTGRQLLNFHSLPIKPGRRYTFRCHYWLDGAAPGAVIWGNHHEFDAKGKTAGYKNLGHYSVACASWNMWECSFFAPTNAASVNVSVIFIGAMEAWVDDASFFEDPPTPLPAPLGSALGGNDSADFAWLMPITKATETGFPSGLVRGDATVRLDAARNEQENFQFVVAARKPLPDVRAELCGLPGKVSVREIRFVPIANSQNPAMNRRHPDPVVPFVSADVGVGSNLVLLASVKVDKAAAAGEHLGELRLTSGGERLATVPVSLRVRGFALPDEASLQSYFYLNVGFGGGAYRKLDPRPAEVIEDEIHAHYREMRLTGNQAATLGKPKWKLEDGKVVVTDWTPYDESVRKLNGRFGFTTIPCPFSKMLGDNSGWFKSNGRGVIKRKHGRTVGDGAPATPFGGFYDEPVGQGRVIDVMRQFLVHAKTAYPHIRFTWYIYDEPPLEVMDTLPGVVKAFADALPDLDLMVVATPHALELEKYSTRVAFFDAFNIYPRKCNFKESWYYQYPTTIEDDIYRASRFYPWKVYRVGGAGVLLWNVIWYGSEDKVYSPWTDLTAYYDSAEPTIFYPPRSGTGEGVLTSMRCINVGDAVDDFDYLKLHERKFGKDATGRLVSSLLPDPLAALPDSVELLKLRRKLADELEGK